MNIWNNIDTDLDDFFLVGHKRDIWLIIPSCQQSSHLVINRVDRQSQKDFDFAFVRIFQEFKVFVILHGSIGYLLIFAILRGSRYYADANARE